MKFARHRECGALIIVFFSAVWILLCTAVMTLGVLWLYGEVFGSEAQAQELIEDYFGEGQGPDGIDVSNPETPAEPDVVTPPPPLLCGYADAPDGVAGCNPVNDWWCSSETACLGTGEFSVAEVLAPSYLSGLNPQVPQPWYQHYQAARADRDGWQERALRCEGSVEEPTPEPTPEPECEDFVDGRFGRVWKPISESTGKAVFLMEKGFEGRNPVITGAGVERSKLSNGSRPTFWLDKYARELPSPTKVYFEGLCLIVPNPEQRYD